MNSESSPIASDLFGLQENHRFAELLDRGVLDNPLRGVGRSARTAVNETFSSLFGRMGDHRVGERWRRGLSRD